MKKVLSIFLAVLLIISSTALAPVSAYSANKVYAEDKIAEIQKLPGFVPGQTAVVTGNCFAFVSAVCEKLYGVTYWHEILYGNFRANHSYTNNYYTVKTFTTTNTYPTSTDVENIISFFKTNAAPGDVMHYGAYTTGTSNGNTHTVMITSIDNEKMGIYHSNYETVDAGRNTCHVDYIYWDSFRKNPTSNEYTSSGHLKSMNSIFYNKMRSTGLGISINRYINYESKFYLKGVSVPEIKTSRRSTHSIRVSWNKVKGATKYQVQYLKDGTGSYVTATADCKNLEYEIKNLELGTLYTFRVRAYVGKEWMGWSGEKQVRVLPPIIPSVTFTMESKGLKMSWTKRTDITGVKVYRATSESGTYSLVKTITDLSVNYYVDTNIKYGTTYYYKFERYVVENSKTYKSTSTVKKGTYKLQKPTVTYDNTSTTSVAFKLAANGKSDKFVYYVNNKNDKTIRAAKEIASNTANIAGLTSGGEYKFYAAQRTSVGRGEYTCVTFKALPARVQGVRVENVNNGLKVTFDTMDDVSGYGVLRSTSKNGKYEKLGEITDKNTNVFLDTKVKYNTNYYYMVYAIATVGIKKNGGHCSSVACGKNTVAKVDNVRAVVRTPASFTVKWNRADNATKYTLQYKPKNGKWKTVGTTNKTSMVCAGLKLGSVYYFRVRGANSIGAGSYSAAASRKTVVPKPATPTAKLTSKGIRVYWTNQSYASGYNIYRSDSPNSGYKLLKTVKNNTTSAWTDTSVQYGNTYYYKVLCYKVVNGKSYNSSMSSYVTKKYKLAVPVLDVETDGTTATLAWNKVEGAGKYSVQYAEVGSEYKTVETTECTKKLKGFTAGKKYIFRVKSMSDKGSSSYCTAESVQF